jgi:hypothetical protein
MDDHDLDYSVVYHEKTGRLLVASDLAGNLAVSCHRIWLAH